jgi:gliding motility-associated-like protein
VKVTHLPLPVVNLGADRELCEGDILELNAFHANVTYHWQDGSTAPTFKVTASGTYLVEVTSQDGCTVTDEINIKYNPLPVVDLGPDRSICANTTTSLDATQSGMTYKWHNGSTAPTFTATAPGKFWVTLTNNKGCSATDTIRVNHLPIPVVDLGHDTTLCIGQELLLNAAWPNSTYRWQDGSSFSTFLVKEAGRYWVEVTNEHGCIVRDDIWVPYLTRPAIALGNDTTLCYGDTLVIGTELPGGVRYLWQDGSRNATLAVTKPGTYKLRAYNQHCEASDEIQVRFKDCIGGLFIPNIITPNGDGLNDVFFIHGLAEDNWELTIYNRWGTVIHTFKNYRNDWAPQQKRPGIYYYHLRHPSTGRTYKGSLEVVY